MIYIEDLGEKARTHEHELNQYEQAQLREYKNEKSNLNARREHLDNVAKNDKIKLRASKEKATGGRMVMGRSTKRDMQKKEKPPDRDIDQENRLKYLGEVAITLDAMTKGGPGTKPDAALLMGKR